MVEWVPADGDTFVTKDGFVFNTSRIYGRRPTIMRGINQLQEGINASGLLSTALKSLVCVRVAQINGCPF